MGGGCIEVGVPAKIQEGSQPNKETILSDFLFRSSKTVSDKRRDTESHEQTSSRDCSGRIGPRILFQTIPGDQKEWETETHYRSQKVEQVSRHPQVQDGVPSDSVGLSSSQQLHLLSGPVGCVFPHTHTSQVQEVPSVCLRGQGVPVCSPPIWFVYKPMDFHKSHVGSEINGSLSSDHVAPVPGRLVSSGNFIPVRTGAGRDSVDSLSRARLDSESGQVRSHSISGLCVHRGQIQSCSVHGLSGREQCTEGQKHCTEVHELRISDSQELAESIGDIGIPRQVCQVCQTSSKTSSMASSSGVESNVRLPSKADSCSSVYKGTTQLVASSGEIRRRSASSSSGVQCESIHRRLHKGVGRSGSEQSLSRSMVLNRSRTPHKCSGDEGSKEGSSSSSSSSRIQHSGRYRQFDCSGLHKQGGRNQIMASDEGNSQFVQTHHETELESQGQIHSRQSECDCRPTVQKGPNFEHRVVSPSFGSQGSVSEMGSTSGGPICNQVQPQVSSICIPSTRPSSLGNRRSDTGPRGHNRVCLSSSTDSIEVPPETSDGSELQSHSGSSILAQTSLVPNSESVVQGETCSASSVGNSSKATKVKNIPPEYRDSQPARMAAREKHLKDKGFEADVVARVVKPHAVTTESIYDGKWRCWIQWCWKSNVDVYSPTLAQVAKFLSYLFAEQKLEFTTIAGYRSMLAGSLFHTGLNIGQDKDLSDLMASFKRSRPPRSRVFPDWDLSLVLWTLTESPFEPMFDETRVSMQMVTWKTAFLTLLASGARRGEIHAIPFRNVSYDKDFNHVTLRPSDEFVTKTQVRTGNRLKPFKIPALSSVLSDDLSADRKLCPCRAIKFYLKRTESIRKMDDKKTLFFVSFDPRKSGDICKNTLSGWISQLIRFCYAQPGKKALEITGSRAHEIRAYSSSLVSKGTSALEDILSSGNWKSHSTFTDHYLRDISQQEGDLIRLGPIVASQKVVIHVQSS